MLSYITFVRSLVSDMTVALWQCTVLLGKDIYTLSSSWQKEIIVALSQLTNKDKLHYLLLLGKCIN